MPFFQYFQSFFLRHKYHCIRPARA
jgi:hypothetical protein